MGAPVVSFALAGDLQPLHGSAFGARIRLLRN
jgi:hypothetical protein